MRKRGNRVILGILALAAATVFAVAPGTGNGQEERAALTSARAERARLLIPGGQLVGVAVMTDGLIYVGASDIGQTASPARVAGLKAGDILKTANGQPIRSIGSLNALMAEGETITFTVDRNGETFSVPVTPIPDPRDGQYRIGAWVRNQSAGVGTLSYIDPATGVYGALAHAITDPDTRTTLTVGAGAIYSAGVTGVVKGQRGQPGELQSDFLESGQILGSIQKNTEQGIFGVYTSAYAGSALFPDGLVAARENEVRSGDAKLISTVSGDTPRLYDCEIVTVNPQGLNGAHGLELKITDDALLSVTGGIVQGMSGSPIIQDGRIIGAITHVLVNDPTRGYGTFIETMLDTAETAMDKAA